MLVDSHCHLDSETFQPELDELVARARAAGVGRLLTICTRLGRVERNLLLAARFPEVSLAVGLHPHYVAEEGVPSADQLAELATDPRIVGLGETGLDYFYDRSPRPQQQESFRNHIAAARRAGVPFIVHTRDADDDTAAILREAAEEGPVKGLLHCFSSGRKLAETAVALGFSLSFSGILTFGRSEELRAIARDMPLDRLLVETDAPYLAPVPLRGKRNEPAYVAHTAAALAKARGLGVAEVAAATTRNFHALFDRVPAIGAA